MRIKNHLMDIREKRRFKRIYDSKKKRLTISMNPEEKSILDAMMQKEEWENIGGFIKYKLFGLNYKKKFENTVRSADDEILKKTLINLFSDLNDQLDYINVRNTRELEDLKRTTPMVDAKTVSKWVSLLNNWNESVESKTTALLDDLQLILKRLDIIVEKKKQDYLRSLPDSVLEEYARNWDDTSSPELIEYTRRMLERNLKK